MTDSNYWYERSLRGVADGEEQHRHITPEETVRAFERFGNPIPIRAFVPNYNEE